MLGENMAHIFGCVGVVVCRQLRDNGSDSDADNEMTTSCHTEFDSVGVDSTMTIGWELNFFVFECRK